MSTSITKAPDSICGSRDIGDITVTTDGSIVEFEVMYGTADQILYRTDLIPRSGKAVLHDISEIVTSVCSPGCGNRIIVTASGAERRFQVLKSDVPVDRAFMERRFLTESPLMVVPEDTDINLHLVMFPSDPMEGKAMVHSLMKDGSLHTGVFTLAVSSEQGVQHYEALDQTFTINPLELGMESTDEEAGRYFDRLISIDVVYGGRRLTLIPQRPEEQWVRFRFRNAFGFFEDLAISFDVKSDVETARETAVSGGRRVQYDERSDIGWELEAKNIHPLMAAQIRGLLASPEVRVYVSGIGTGQPQTERVLVDSYSFDDRHNALSTLKLTIKAEKPGRRIDISSSGIFTDQFKDPFQ